MSPPASGLIESGAVSNRAIGAAALVGLIGLAVAAVVHPFRDALFLMAVALMLHIALNPLVDRLQRLGMHRRAAVVAVYAVVVSAVVGSAMALGPGVIAQTRAMAAALPDLYGRLRDALIHDPRAAMAAAGGILPDHWDPSALREWFTRPTAPGPDAVVPMGTATRAARWLVDVMAIFVLAFYLTADRDRLIQGLLFKVPHSHRDAARDLVAEIERKAGRFYRGQLILCGIVGVAAAAVYAILGLPYALLLGVLAAVLEAVPLIGASLGLLAPVIVALTHAPHLVLPVVALGVTLQLIEANILTPRIMGRSVGVNAVASIVAVLVMASLYGLLGAFIAIPAAAIVQIVVGRWIFDAAVPTIDGTGAVTAGPDGSPAPARGALAVLRYRALELQQDAAKRMREPDRTRDASIHHEAAVEEIAAAAHALLLWIAAPPEPDGSDAAPGVATPSAPASAEGVRDGRRMTAVQRTVAVIVAMASLGILLWEVRAILAVVLAGIVLSTALRAPVLTLVRRGVSRRAAVAIIGTLLAAGAAGGGWVMWNEVARLPQLAGDVLRVAGGVRDALARGSQLGAWIAGRLPDLAAGTAWLTSSTPGPGATDAMPIAIVRGGFRFFSAVGLAIVIAAYWLVDGDYFARLWLSLLPSGRRALTLNAWETAQDRLGAYLRSEVGQGAFVAAALAALFGVLGVHGAVLASLLVATAWFVPFFGAPIALTIAFAFGAVQGTRTAVWAAVLTALVLLISEVVVERRLLGRRQYASILTVLVLIGLTRMAGLVGLLAAPIVAQAIDVVWRHLWHALRQPVSVDGGSVAERLAALHARREAFATSLALDTGAAADGTTSLTERLDALLADVEEVARELGHA